MQVRVRALKNFNDFGKRYCLKNIQIDIKDIDTDVEAVLGNKTFEDVKDSFNLGSKFGQFNQSGDSYEFI